MDDLDQISNFYDNILHLTYNFKFIKKLFWNVNFYYFKKFLLIFKIKNSDLFSFSISQLNRYLPNSAASMKLGLKSAKRRIKELELNQKKKIFTNLIFFLLRACIGFIETLAVMFQETEFYASRNLILYEEKYLRKKFFFCLLNFFKDVNT